MQRFLGQWLISGLALAFAAWALGANMSIGTAGAPTSDRLISLAIVGAVFAVISLVIAPVVKALALPLVILSLGLALLVINALLLLLTEWITDRIDFAVFEINGFVWAVIAALIVSIAQSVIGIFIRVK